MQREKKRKIRIKENRETKNNESLLSPSQTPTSPLSLPLSSHCISIWKIPCDL